jgi:hypothetical protein
MSDAEKEMIKTMKHCNMPTRDMVAVLAFIRSGMAKIPYNKRKVSNYTTSINREVKNNDMMEVLDWFFFKQRMRTQVSITPLTWMNATKYIVSSG